MGTQWTSKYAILRDLSYAQGRKVPAAIVGSVGVGQKPPAIKIKEDTEEEFFENCVGDGELYTKPDLNLIKQMLNMVQESDTVGDDGDGDNEKIVEISKLNPLSEEFVPVLKGPDERKGIPYEVPVEPSASNIDIEAKAIQDNTKEKGKTQKKRRERNVALLSLLEKEQSLRSASPREENILSCTEVTSERKPEANNSIQNSDVKLLKPNDFIIDSNIIEAVEKVNKWLEKPVEPQVEKTKLTVSPKSMFKKKTPAPPSFSSACMFKRKSDTSSIRSSDSDTVPRQADNVFIPSNHANEYYKKFVERRQVQEMAQEDIWERAERLMKEIDAKRLKEKENLAESLDAAVAMNVHLEGESSDTDDGPRPSLPLNIPGLDIPSVRTSIRLLQHRHDLPEKCKVCLALAKYKQRLATSQ